MPSAREPRHPLEKRDLLHSDPVKTKTVNEVAGKLLAEGRYAEGIDYIENSRSPELLTVLEKQALEVGSPFLLAQVERIRGDEAPAGSWERIAEIAQGAERWMDAVRALARAGRADDAEALRVEKCPDYEPFKPLGK